MTWVGYMDLVGLSLPTLVTAIAVAIAMSALHSIVGFAFGLLATPVFLLLFPPKDVVILTVLLMLLLNALIIYSDHRVVVVSALRSIAVPVLFGLPIGLYILTFVSAQTLAFLVGVTTATFASLLLLGQPWLEERVHRVPVIVGLLGGLLTTSINFNAPPIVMYLTSLRMNGAALRATTAAYLMASHILALLLFAGMGLLTTRIAAIALILSPGCMFGYLIGARISRHVRSEILPKLMLVVVLAMGVATTALSGFVR